MASDEHWGASTRHTPVIVQINKEDKKKLNLVFLRPGNF